LPKQKLFAAKFIVGSHFIRIKNKLKAMEVEKMNSFFVHYFNVLLDYSPRVISAALVLLIGLWGIKILSKVAERIMIRRELEPTLIQFILDILIWGVRILLFVTVISRLGIETSSFVAILGAIGLAVGMSLQGSLSNFAGGMLIIMFKPFKVGDNIDAQGEIGKVLEIHIFTTKILTAQNQIVYIPNGALSNGKIKNFSQKNIRRSDLIIRTNYASDIKIIKTQLEEISKNHPKVLKSPAPEVTVNELTDATVNFSVKVWVKNADLSVVNSDILEQSKGVVKL
jgi:small conductance mechanosensitive channel